MARPRTRPPTGPQRVMMFVESPFLMLFTAHDPEGTRGKNEMSETKSRLSGLTRSIWSLLHHSKLAFTIEQEKGKKARLLITVPDDYTDWDTLTLPKNGIFCCVTCAHHVAAWNAIAVI